MMATELADVSMGIWDVVVIGAGPAGGMAACEAARQGVSVLLVDRASFPRDKVCGCCLNPAARAELDAAGLERLLAECGARRIDHVVLAGGRRRATLRLPPTAAVSRATFDARLATAACDAGAVFVPGVSVASLARRPTGRTMVLRRKGGAVEVRARMVIAATGITGRALDAELPVTTRKGSRIGVSAIVDTALPATDDDALFMTCDAGGYVGMVRLEDGRLNVAAALDPRFVRGAGGPSDAVAAILRRSKAAPPAEIVADARFRGTPPLTRTRHAVAAPRVLVTGDAAGYVEPFTGEGMAWALVTGRAAAGIAVHALRERWPDERLVAAWSRRHRELVGARQRSCRRTARWLRSPRLVGAVLALLDGLPAAAPALTRLVLGARAVHSAGIHADGARWTPFRPPRSVTER